MVLSLDDNSQVPDQFKGVKLKWISHKIDPTASSLRWGYPNSDDKRYFTLSFHRRHRELITTAYLRHVLEEGKRIALKNRKRKLYTNGSTDIYRSGKSSKWISVDFEHPASFETLALDPKLKKDIMKDLLKFKTERITIPNSSKSIIVIEDIDCSLDLTGQRKKKNKKKKDGVQSSNSSDPVNEDSIDDYSKERKNGQAHRASYCGFGAFKVLAKNYLDVESHDLFSKIGVFNAKEEAVKKQAEDEEAKLKDKRMRRTNYRTKDRDKILKLMVPRREHVLWWKQTKWSHVLFEHPASFDTLAMEPEKKQEIIKDLLKFKKGKSIMLKLGKLGKEGHTELKKLLIDTSNKSIIVIEDIDWSLDLTGHGRMRRRKLVVVRGLICVYNYYVDKLDPALIRRGRMDKHIELSYCGFEAFKADVAENLMPKSDEDDADKCLKNLVDAIEIAKEEAIIGLFNHEVYTAIQNYLSANSSSRAKRLRANDIKDNKSLVLSLDDNEEVTEEFQGVKLWWTSSKKIPQGSSNPFYPNSDEKRYFKLTFHRTHRQLITESFLAHVLEEGKGIAFKNRQRKLYTNGSEKAGDINDLLKFKNGKEYYAKIGKAWKRGYLLYGPPGTGKSTMISAMANFLDYDVYDLELTAVKDNTELRKLLIETSNKSIIVIEDIDCSLDLTGQRKEKKKDEDSEQSKDPVSVQKRAEEEACGGERLIVFTTNYVDKLDPALIRRGRMDKHIELSYCGFEAFKVLAKNYLDVESHDLFSKIERLLGEIDTTPADVAENLMPKSDEEDADKCLKNLIEALENAKEEAIRKKAEDEAKLQAAEEEKLEEESDPKSGKEDVKCKCGNGALDKEVKENGSLVWSGSRSQFESKSVFGVRVRVRALRSDPGLGRLGLCPKFGFNELTGERLMRSEAYSAIENYLSTNSSLHAKRLKADVVKSNNQSLVLSMDDHEEVVDEFKGVKLWWASGKNNSKTQTVSFYQVSDERRYYILTFHKRHRELIVGAYLNHVLKEGKAIKVRNRQRKLYTNHGSYWSHVVFQHPATFQTLALEQEKKQDIIDDLIAFSQAEEFYARIGRAWKRGYLLYGPPGTGKSTMISAMANLLNYDIYDLELTALTGQRKKKKKEKKEDDQDGKEHKEKKEEKEDKNSQVTLSGLLNFIDGICF
ncbi:hypothetical protein F8388_025501 [Cannabis sativa]|uniref:AAA+ ATPase domain-containing protein n=1 Tax=Cannabis sativa TaxID=3483 RepID=A0A7J6G3H8_CANSA|nr:hypothetical protein F8388_025501 [Cannabis sativa]